MRTLFLGSAIGGAAMLAGCLEPNSDFDEPASTSGTTSATDASGSEASSTDGSALETSSTTETECTPDGFEMEGEPSVQATLGELELVLETIDGVDRYNIYRAAETPKTFYASADADVRVCVYMQCEDVPEYADITCNVGLAASQPDSGVPGCCGGRAVDLAYVCGGTTTAKADIWIDMPPADCTPYTLLLADTAP